jgi:ATP-binding cassette subfamily B (MDR/TAP) protein 1
MGTVYDDKSGLEGRRRRADGQPHSSSRWKQFFCFTSPRGICILIAAVVTAGLNATGKTAFPVILGYIFQAGAKYGDGSLSGQSLYSQVSLWCGYMAVMGLGVWFFSSLDLSLWITSGALRAKKARETLFSVLIEKEMDWFDSREDGISSLVIQTQG